MTLEHVSSFDDGNKHRQHHHEDDEGLWDELSTQQSKEIQQHHRRISISSHNRSNKSTKAAATANAIRDAIQHTTAALSSALSSASNTPTTITRKTLTANSRTSIQQHENHQLNLAEFGLESTSSASHSQSYAHTSNVQIAHPHIQSNPPPTMHSSNHQHPLIYNDNSLPPASPLAKMHPSTMNENNHMTNTSTDHASAPLLANDYHLSTPASTIDRNDNNSNRGGHGMDFVFLKKFRILPKSEGWGAVPNLDLFFTSIYNYYYHRGITVIIGKGIVEIISLFFTLILSVFLFAYMDWGALSTCHDETTCRNKLTEYMVEKPFSSLSAWNLYIIIYCIIFASYGLFKIFTFLVTAQDALEAKAFYENKLGISQRELEGGGVEWDFVVQKIITLQNTGEHRIAIHGQTLDALVVSHRILRKENFMVSFFNNGLLDLRVPLPWPLSSSGWSRQHYLSKSLEWSLYFCIFSYMFNHKFQLRPEFCMSPSALKRRLVVCGIAQALFMPFLLIFMVFHFTFLNFHEWKSSQQYLGPKEWSNLAKWTFREFNELPHSFERRLAPSYESAEEYLKLFTKSSAMICLGQVIVFMSGSILAVLLAFASINDSILLHVQISNWTLFWYVGVFGAIFSAGRSLLPDGKTHNSSKRWNLFKEMDTGLTKVSLSTHYLPDTWRGRGWEKRTQNQFSQMFQAKAQLFLMEILSVIFAPLVLIISLPKCANDICMFVQKVKVDVPGVGQVCGFSSFDFNAFEDENWIGREINNTNNRTKMNLHTARARPKARQGKMEKSFFSFKSSHPSWKCTQSGQNLVDRLEKYQLEQTKAMLARERHLRIEAANKELETLLLLERAGIDNDTDNKNNFMNINESYMAKKVDQHFSHAISNQGPQSINVNLDTNPNTHAEVPLKAYDNEPGLKNENAKNRIERANEGDKQLVPTGKSILRSGIDLSSLNQSMMPNTNLATNDVSVMHYADAGLSMELRRVLNKSILELGGMSAMRSTIGRGGLGRASSVAGISYMANDTNQGLSKILDESTELENASDLEQNHFWLEQYHSRINEPSANSFT